MNVLPDFELLRPTQLSELLAMLQATPAPLLLGGGTDLLVNIRRGIGAPPSRLLDVNHVTELGAIAIEDGSVRIGASVKISELARDPRLLTLAPVLVQAAHSVAGPTQRNMGTVGGNLCLDTRCIYYNQSEWWREANDYCLKWRGDVCHVAPKSKTCYATFSGDLAPALMVLDANVEIASATGVRSMPLADLYTGDGQHYLNLGTRECVVAVRFAVDQSLRSAYDKVRVRRSIDYPLAGVGVALRTSANGPREVRVDSLRVAVSGTNARPLSIEGLATLEGRVPDASLVSDFEALARKQIMAMRTTFTSGHYRRRAALVIAARLIHSLAAH